MNDIRDPQQWRMFFDTERDWWHIANPEMNNSICIWNAELIGLTVDFDPMGTRPLCAHCVANAVHALNVSLTSEHNRAEHYAAQLEAQS